MGESERVFSSPMTLQDLDDLQADNKCCDTCFFPFIDELPTCCVCDRHKKFKRGHNEILRAVDPQPCSQEGDDEDSGDEDYAAMPPPAKNARLVPLGQRPSGVCSHALLGLFELPLPQQQPRPRARTMPAYVMRAFAIFSQAPSSASGTMPAAEAHLVSSANVEAVALEAALDEAALDEAALDEVEPVEPSTPRVDPVELLEAGSPIPTTPSKESSTAGLFRSRASRVLMPVQPRQSAHHQP